MGVLLGGVAESKCSTYMADAKMAKMLWSQHFMQAK